MDANYYIYCITTSIPEDIKLNMVGMEDEKITAIDYEDICAIVSKTLKTSYELSLENLKCHEKVALSVMDYCTVLPLNFSTISKDEDSVKSLLKKYYDQFIENLSRVKGKIELGIKVFYKLDYEYEDKKDKSTFTDPKDYMKKRYERYQERKKQLEKILEVCYEIDDVLSEISCESCFTTPLKNNLIFNGAYLVKKQDKDRFSQYVDRIRNDYLEYKVVYSGPWCPYNFVKLIKEGE